MEGEREAGESTGKFIDFHADAEVGTESPGRGNRAGIAEPAINQDRVSVGYGVEEPRDGDGGANGVGDASFAQGDSAPRAQIRGHRREGVGERCEVTRSQEIRPLQPAHHGQPGKESVARQVGLDEKACHASPRHGRKLVFEFVEGIRGNERPHHRADAGAGDDVRPDA